MPVSDAEFEALTRRVARLELLVRQLQNEFKTLQQRVARLELIVLPPGATSEEVPDGR